MAKPLVRCSTCKRHIYASETSCPFCARQPSVSPTVLAAALTAGLAIAGCGAETSQGRTTGEVAPQPGQPNEVAEDPKPEPTRGTPAAVYGAPPPMDPAPVPPAAAYGAPPPMPVPKPR